jgi:hypothetical protein
MVVDSDRRDLDVASSGSLTGIVSGQMAIHVAAADPHTGYRLESEDHDHSSTGLQGGNIPATSVTISKIGTPTYGTAQDFVDSFGSCGRKTGGIITDAGSGYVAVSAGTGFIKATDDDNAALLSFNWAAPSNISIPTDSTRYIGVEYNSGSPQVVARDTESWDLDTEFPLGLVVNDTLNSTATLHILNNPWWITDGTTNILERFQAEGHIVRDRHVGGLIPSVTGTRNIAVSSGVVWSNVNEFDISEIDTSVSGTVEAYWYSSTGGWQTSDVIQYSVLLWNDTAQATLQNIANNKYCNIWLYVEADDTEITIIYPQAEYVSASLAAAASTPAMLPPHVTANGILIGKIVIKQGVDEPVAVLSAFANTFSTAVVADHGNLAGLSDDDHTQYLLVDGTRAFTGVVGGVTPTDDAHLATKAYVDNRDFAAERLSNVIMYIPASTGLYYDDTNHDVRIRTSVASDTVNILILQGWWWNSNSLKVEV